MNIDENKISQIKKLCELLQLFIFIFLTNFTANSQCYWAKGIGSVTGCQVFGYSVKTDNLGNIYVGGRFSCTVDFDPGIGVSNLSSTGQIDNFICKFNPNGNFIWAKKFGSTTNDFLSSIFVDELGNVISCGYFTGTADFDPGVGSFNLSSSGSTDIFVLKLDTDGNFIWAKKIGGTGAESANSITVDANANIIYTGFFNGTVDFDPGVGISNLTSSGQNDIVISKLDLNGNFAWAKKIGGGSMDQGVSITVDSILDIYTTGSFLGTVDFDPGVGTFNLGTTGSQAIYVNKLDSSGNFIWAKCFSGTGGSGVNQGNGNSIAIDRTLNIVTTGYFSGTLDFDPGANIFNLSSSGQEDIFVNKLDSNGNFVWAKKIGGSGMDFGNSIVADSSGFLYSTGYFENTVDFDPNSNTYNLISAGVKDIFINKMDPNGNHIWTKRIGGSGVGGDEGNSITLDRYSNIITTGIFSSIVDFNPDLGIFNLTSIGYNDVFIHKINTSFVNPNIIPNGPLSFCTGGSVTLSSSYTTGNIWSNGVTTQSISTSNSGSFFVSNIDSVCFSSSDSISIVVNPIPTTPVITAGSSTTFCQGNSVALTSSPATSYLWSTGDTTRTITALTAGSYTVTVYNASGCSSSSLPVNITVTPNPNASASANSNFCSGNTLNLVSSGGNSYNWSGPGGFNSTLQNPTRTNATASMSGLYLVTVSLNGCSDTASVQVTIYATPTRPTISVSQNLNFCQGDSVILTSNYTFGNLWSNGQTTRSITVRTAGQFSVTHNNGFCNSQTSLPVTTSINPSSPIPNVTVNGPLTFCQSDSVILTSNYPNTSPYYVAWYNGSTFVSSGQSLVVKTSGTYYSLLQYTPPPPSTTIYCPSYSTPLTVTVLSQSNPPTITASGPLTICSGSSVTLTSSSTTGNLWSNGATTSSIIVSSSGNYSVRVNNGACNSLSSNSLSVSVVSPPSTPVINFIGSLNLCKGEMVTLSTNQTNGIIWSNGETTQYVDIYDAGTYSVSVSNGICPIVNSTPLTINVNNPDISITHSGQLAENNPNTPITFTANTNNVGVNPIYQWFKNGLTVGNNSPTYTNGNWVNGEKIVCRVTSSSGCSVYSNDLFVWLAQANQDSWQRMADIGIDKNLITKRFPNRTGAISFAIGNKVYVGLGYSVNSPVTGYNSEYLSDFWEYNTATDEWTERASFAYGNSPRINSSCFTLNGKAYVIGGIDAFGTYKNDVWEYDPQIDSWTQKSNFPGAARHSATAASIYGVGYFGTGWGFNNNNLKDWWSYDPSTDSWTQQASLTTPTTDNFATTSSVVDGKICLVGANYACAFDVFTNSWIQKPTLPASLYYAKSFGIDSFLYVIGGQETPINNNPCSGIKTKNSVWQLNLNTNIWVRKTDIILGNSSNGSLAVVDQKAYFISGGFGQACQASNYFNFGGGSESALMIYDPFADSWQLGSPLGGIKPSFGFSATIGNKGYTLVQYSFNSSNVVGFTNSNIYMFEYDALNNTWKQKSQYPGLGNMNVGGGFVLNNKIYYGSGQDYNFNYTTDFWEYNPQTDSWSNVGNIPIGITKPFTFSLNNKGYMGGSNMGNSFFEFNPSTFTWSQRASIPINPLSSLHFSLGNFGYVGAIISPTLSELYKYDPIINIWQSMGFLPFNNPLFSFQNNNFGYCGLNTNQNTSTIYEYNQSTNNWMNKMGLPKISGNNFTSFNFSSNSFVFGGSEPINTTSTTLFPVNDLWQYRPSSQITSVESDFAPSNNIKIYPNPVKNTLTLEVDPSFLGTNYRIVDVLGREILKGTIKEEINQINLQDLVPGIYILFGEKESIKYKIVKE